MNYNIASKKRPKKKGLKKEDKKDEDSDNVFLTDIEIKKTQNKVKPTHPSENSEVPSKTKIPSKIRAKQLNTMNTDTSKANSRLISRTKINNTDASAITDDKNDLKTGKIVNRRNITDPSPNKGRSTISKNENDSETRKKSKNQKGGQNKLQIKTVEQLLLHATDTQVKPIIGDEIEELPELEYKRELLNFNILTPDEVKDDIDSPGIESFLTEIYTAIASNGTTKEKINVLTYFESLIKSSNTANRLINSAFVILLL